MYQPAFTETFLVLILVVLWCRWLEDRWPRWGTRLSMVAGTAVLISQFGAVVVLLGSGATTGGGLLLIRWLGMGTCLATLAACLVLTGLRWVRKSPE